MVRGCVTVKPSLGKASRNAALSVTSQSWILPRRRASKLSYDWNFPTPPAPTPPPHPQHPSTTLTCFRKNINPARRRPASPSCPEHCPPAPRGEAFWPLVLSPFRLAGASLARCSPETWLDLDGWSISWRRCQSSQRPRALMAALSSRFRFTSPRMRPGSTYNIHTSSQVHLKKQLLSRVNVYFCLYFIRIFHSRFSLNFYWWLMTDWLHRALQCASTGAAFWHLHTQKTCEILRSRRVNFPFNKTAVSAG